MGVLLPRGVSHVAVEALDSAVIGPQAPTSSVAQRLSQRLPI